MWQFLWLGVRGAGRAPGPRYPPCPYRILAGAPVPPAEAAVTEPAASTHRQGLGGCGQGLPQPGALGAEPLQPPQRPGLGAGGQLLAEAAAPQPVQLQSAHGAVECVGGCPRWVYHFPCLIPVTKTSSIRLNRSGKSFLIIGESIQFITIKYNVSSIHRYS